MACVSAGVVRSYRVLPSVIGTGMVICAKVMRIELDGQPTNPLLHLSLGMIGNPQLFE